MLLYVQECVLVSVYASLYLGICMSVWMCRSFDIRLLHK